MQPSLLMPLFWGIRYFPQVRFTYWWVRNYLIWILCNCFTGTVLWLVSRELLSSHSFFQGSVLQPVGRASVVVGTDQTTATVALPARALQAHRTRDEIGNQYIMLKDQWKQRHWHRGLWQRPQKHKEQRELMKKAVVLLERREWLDEEKGILKLCHMKIQATALSQGGDHKSTVKLCEEYMLWAWRDFWLVT